MGNKGRAGLQERRREKKEKGRGKEKEEEKERGERKEEKGKGKLKRKGKRRGRGSVKERGIRRGKRKGRSKYDVPSCRGPRRTQALQSAGLPRAPDRGGPGCAICSPGLVRSGGFLSPACFPSAAAWTAARPARAPAAPRCVGCAGGQRVPSARLRRGVCGPRARSARPALPRGLPLSPPAAPAAPWRPPKGERALAHRTTPGEEGPLGT